jgi:branched-chain amino acid transport system substrate-binding protein
MKNRILKRAYLWFVVACLCFGGLLALSSAVHAQETLKIACITALTGVVGPIGQSQLAGAKVAEMHINEEGGILGKKILIIERDDAASPATAVKVVRELAMNEKIKFFVGGVSSAEALAVSALMEQLDSLYFVVAAGTPKLTGVNCNPHVFRLGINSVAQHRSIAKLVLEKYPNLKKWANISPDYEYGHQCYQAFSSELKRLNPGVTFVESVWPKFMAKTFEPEILKILQAKPEAVFSSLYSGDFITFVKQAKKYKFFDDLKALFNPSIEIDVAQVLGHEMVNCWGGNHYYYEAFDNPVNKRFIAGHKKLYGTFPIYASGEGYSAMYALKYAIEKAKTFETKPLIFALRGMIFESPNGKRIIRPEDHQGIKTDVSLHFVPTKEPPGWKIDEVKVISEEPFIPKLEEPDGGCKMKW